MGTAARALTPLPRGRGVLLHARGGRVLLSLLARFEGDELIDLAGDHLINFGELAALPVNAAPGGLDQIAHEFLSALGEVEQVFLLAE